MSIAMQRVAVDQVLLTLGDGENISIIENAGIFIIRADNNRTLIMQCPTDKQINLRTYWPGLKPSDTYAKR